jgi:hypothetical protein
MSGGRRGSPALAVPLAAATAIVAVPLFTATTFFGDDHLFLAFARHAPNPLVAFVRDQHGGEFYRPLPMLVWWVLGHAARGAAGVAAWPFAALALALHAASAALLAALLAALDRPRGVAWLAAALFFLAPQNLDAASWFSASTDLLATAFSLAALVALVRGAPLVSALLALAAFVSKESALVLPALAFAVLGARPQPPSRGARVRAVLPHAALAFAVLVARARVLGGWGGSGDERAPFAAKLLQLASGLVHVAPGAVLPEPLAWGLGGAALALLVLFSRRSPSARPALAFVALALVPLLGPGWIVGARYFYLPAGGLAWAAAEALAARPFAARAILCGALVVLGAVQASRRGEDVAQYDGRVRAARRAVLTGARAGARVFHVAGAVKDLDLAVKEDAALAPFAAELLVLGDVPASFVLLPPRLAEGTGFLLASPPLPPSGAYRFGDARIVGLARRGDDPTLDEVIARFPDIRFIRVRPTPGRHVIALDVTDEVKGDAD